MERKEEREERREGHLVALIERKKSSKVNLLFEFLRPNESKEKRGEKGVVQSAEERREERGERREERRGESSGEERRGKEK